MPDGEYGLVAPAPGGSVSPSALADNESVSRTERNKSTVLSAGDARFAGRDTLLQGPIASRLIGLAFPILIVLAVQTLVSVAETYFVGFLGDDALAGAQACQSSRQGEGHDDSHRLGRPGRCLAYRDTRMAIA